MKFENYMILEFPSKSANEAFARSAVACFAAQLDPTLEELGDIRTAVSEAVTNCIVHGYSDKVGKIYITANIFKNCKFRVKIKDKGCGIEDIKKAMEPLYTSLGGERAGLGFAVMESLCDKITVKSVPQKGTTVTLEKSFIGRGNSDDGI
jgi:stage II sporulation protein AB (anti-sigma F factor)